MSSSHTDEKYWSNDSTNRWISSKAASSFSEWSTPLTNKTRAVLWEWKVHYYKQRRVTSVDNFVLLILHVHALYSKRKWKGAERSMPGWFHAQGTCGLSHPPEHFSHSAEGNWNTLQAESEQLGGAGERVGEPGLVCWRWACRGSSSGSTSAKSEWHTLKQHVLKFLNPLRWGEKSSISLQFSRQTQGDYSGYHISGKSE